MIVLAMVFIPWLLAHTLKVVTASLRTKRLVWKVVFLPGGMPSAHSTLVASLLTTVFLMQGISLLFSATLVFTMIVLYDAMTLRRQVGEHTLLLQRLHMRVTKEEAKQALGQGGHTPGEVLAGVALGIVVPLVIFYA